MSVKMNFDGFRKFQQKLERTTQPRRFQLDELMTSAFLRAHTQFSSLAEMQAASGIQAPNPKEFVESDEWNRFVCQSTTFGSWKEMLGAAYSEHLKRQLDHV